MNRLNKRVLLLVSIVVVMLDGCCRYAAPGAGAGRAALRPAAAAPAPSLR